jgi:hypothetical protein
MANLLEKNEAMQIRNRQRMNAFIADYLTTCEETATATRNEYRKLPKKMQTETVIASARYWDNVAKGLRWARESLKLKAVKFHGPKSPRDNASE